jgi:3-dehydroquinate dehydratase
MALLPLPLLTLIEVRISNIEKHGILRFTRDVAKCLILGFGLDSFDIGLGAIRR